MLTAADQVEGLNFVPLTENISHMALCVARLSTQKVELRPKSQRVSGFSDI